ncbi:MAG: hypothetical protein IPG77_07995 [Betaproteobacteria bacterium]|nr:hypothetical protein [Betaproteobacteria bacterium]
MDLRQNSDKHEAVVAEVLPCTARAWRPDYAAVPDYARRERLLALLNDPFGRLRVRHVYSALTKRAGDLRGPRAEAPGRL